MAKVRRSLVSSSVPEADFWSHEVYTQKQIQDHFSLNDKKFRGWLKGYQERYGGKKVAIQPLGHFRDGDLVLVPKSALIRFVEQNSHAEKVSGD